jgi:hypothetical protein
MATPRTILAFYRSEGVTAEGHRLREILEWDDVRLEEDHAFIQWLFPTFRPSGFNRNAPVLTDEVADEFRRDASLRENLLRSFDRMLCFYGLLRTPNGIVTGPNWDKRRKSWLVYGDHNYLRITRILDSLTSLGLEETALVFLKCLKEIAASDDGRREIDPQTLDYWRRAANGRIV